MDAVFSAAERFVLGEARLLERRLFGAAYLGLSPSGVVDALRGYQNGDGGFGHALEPDVRCPASLPLATEVALQVMVASGTVEPSMVLRACDYLAGTAETAGAGGGVPLALPVIEGFARAEHMTEWTYVPALNPTAGLAGLLYQLQVEHPWREQATTWCWAQLERDDAVTDAHTLSEVLVFLEHVPDRERAIARARDLAERFDDIAYLQIDPEAEGYGLSPLHMAPTPWSPWLDFFPPDAIEAHLARLQAAQQADGGWPITWSPPTQAAVTEWRGVVTVQAVRTLTAYGRVDNTP
jgi:hypothetical protein